MNRLSLGMALLLFLAADQTDLVAQHPVPGADLRLEAKPSQDLRGYLVELGADSLRLEDPGSGFVYVVPTVAVERLRVSQPRSRGRGALRGLLIGSVVGALSFGTLLAIIPSDGNWGAGTAFEAGAIVGGVGGAGLGAGVGALWPGKRWADVPLQH
jgi:hypothetical protein